MKVQARWLLVAGLIFFSVSPIFAQGKIGEIFGKIGQINRKMEQNRRNKIQLEFQRASSELDLEVRRQYSARSRLGEIRSRALSRARTSQQREKIEAMFQPEADKIDASLTTLDLKKSELYSAYQSALAESYGKSERYDGFMDIARDVSYTIKTVKR